MKIKKDCNLTRWQKEYGVEGVCSRCKKVSQMTVDHVIPVYLLEQMGFFDECLNDTDNFELVCRTCNQFKSSRLDLANPRTTPLLKKYVERL